MQENNYYNTISCMLGPTAQPVSEIERPTKTQSSFSAINVRKSFICRAIPDAAIGAVPLGGPYSRRGVTRIALVQAAAWSSSASP